MFSENGSSRRVAISQPSLTPSLVSVRDSKPDVYGDYMVPGEMVGCSLHRPPLSIFISIVSLTLPYQHFLSSLVPWRTRQVIYKGLWTPDPVDLPSPRKVVFCFFFIPKSNCDTPTTTTTRTVGLIQKGQGRLSGITTCHHVMSVSRRRTYCITITGHYVM